MNPFLQNTGFAVSILVLVALGLSLCTYLFASCKREIWTTRCAVRGVDETLAALSMRLMNEVADLGARMKACEERTTMLAAAPAAASGLNGARRAQAVRMLRHGAEPVTIAAALAVRAPEIELLASIEALAAATMARRSTEVN